MSRFGDAWRALVAGAEQRSQATDTLAYMLEASGRGSRARTSLPPVTQDSAFKNSVWFAGLTLWADVMSSFPLTVQRLNTDGLYTPVRLTSPMFVSPSPGVSTAEFIYSTTMDKKRYGNAIGIITGRAASGMVTQVELQPMSTVTADMKGNKLLGWRIGNDYYNPQDIWHEKEYTLPGIPLGFSPLAYAAYTMSLHQSAQEFALDWFALGANPRGVLQNVERSQVPSEIRQDAKDQFRESTSGGDIFVTGKEWEWHPQQQDQMSSNFLDQMAASDRDVCRYLGVPASMIDVEVSTGNITYANITQANLQWLITRVGPFTNRTEQYWSKQCSLGTQTVNMDTDVLLRMDPQTRNQLMIAQSDAMLRVPTELRALDNLPPYTPEQLAETAFYARLRKPPPLGTPTDPNDPLPDPAPAQQPVSKSAREDVQPWQIPA